MQLSLLQLNSNSDNFWDKLIPFLTGHDFDIIQLQELTGKDTRSGNIASKRDTFIELQKILADRYNGELAIAQRYASSPTSYFGNATFYKKSFSLLKKNILSLHDNPKPFPLQATNFEDISRNLLHLQLSIAGKTLSFLNTHFAWANRPTEHPHQTQQGEILLSYLQTIPKPFILSGDFNLTPDQPLIQKLSKHTRNFIAEHHVTNTLNPRTHYVKQLFPPGLAVDYIFTSPDLQVTNFTVITEDISDHFGLTAKIEI